MLVKLYVGEDRNLYVCWWSMLAKSFLYVGEKNCMLVKNLNRKLNVCWWSMLLKNFLYVGEHFEQKFKCMLVKYVGETFSVCWWKVSSWKNFRFHQHTGFSPTYIFHQYKFVTEWTSRQNALHDVCVERYVHRHEHMSRSYTSKSRSYRLSRTCAGHEPICREHPTPRTERFGPCPMTWPGPAKVRNLGLDRTRTEKNF